MHYDLKLPEHVPGDILRLSDADIADIALALHDQALNAPVDRRPEARLRKAIMPAFIRWLRDEAKERGTPPPELAVAAVLVQASILGSIVMMCSKRGLEKEAVAAFVDGIDKTVRHTLEMTGRAEA
jgi:AcrR family transcriptional regulator